MTNTNEVRIETCTLCNYKCKFCPQHTESFTRKKEIMTFSTFKFIVDKLKEEAPQITDITISGFGEAFLDKTLLSKIKYAKKNKYIVHVLTNGSFLTEDLIDDLFKIKINDLRISLHTTKIRSYFKVTDQYKIMVADILNNIHYAIENKGNTDIIITADIIDENREDVEEFIHYFKYEPVTIEIWEPHNWVNWKEYRKGEMVKKTCGRPFNGPLQIGVTGNINMCCFDFNEKILLGNFLNQTLEEIFTSKIYIDLYKHHKNGTIQNSNFICKDCDQLIDSGKDIVVYNNKFTKEERIGKTSTNYKELINE